jgi:hypothetical protein
MIPPREELHGISVLGSFAAAGSPGEHLEVHDESRYRTTSVRATILITRGGGVCGQLR